MGRCELVGGRDGRHEQRYEASGGLEPGEDGHDTAGGAVCDLYVISGQFLGATPADESVLAEESTKHDGEPQGDENRGDFGDIQLADSDSVAVLYTG